jgi:hypothetical protein
VALINLPEADDFSTAATHREATIKGLRIQYSGDPVDFLKGDGSFVSISCQIKCQ